MQEKTTTENIQPKLPRRQQIIFQFQHNIFVLVIIMFGEAVFLKRKANATLIIVKKYGSSINEK